jgi:Rrf2 family protein
MRLEITRKSDLAVRALRTLDACRVTWKAEDLAAVIGTTPGFLGQVMTPLVHAGWVHSSLGPTGGYHAVGDRPGPSLLAIIEAIEGPTDDGRCVLRDGTWCAVREARPTCALHAAWRNALSALIEELASTPAIEAAPAPRRQSDGREERPRRTADASGSAATHQLEA